MSVSRLVSPAVRSGLVVAVGSVLLVGPVVLGLSTTAASVGLVVGALTIALGLAGSEDSGRGTLPMSAQAVYDAGLAVGLLLTAVLFGLAGDLAAASFFGLAGLATGVLTATTRYALATAS